MKRAIGVVQALLVAGFLMAGSSKLFSSAEQIRAMFTETMGLGAGFMYVVGAIETIAALALIVGFWKREIAAFSAAVLTIVMIGAVAATLIAGLGADVVMQLLYLVLLALFLPAKLGGFGRLGAGRSGVARTK
ncbi:DoxX family membrane protein [Paenibacillus antri]|uniref:DoxX family membrane protein n=1 Tax=Paenibacillus antri TaxID=2582848 RepID=A0A5R9G864_9BACL|nr:DoxX family protein [Paenibacillus antri]TLS49628.1 DoxX family membrane protein [Paenibacillus antri]